VGGVIPRTQAVHARDVVGAPQEVRSVLERAYAEGRLVSLTEPQPVVRVQLVLREEPPPPARPSRFHPARNPAPYLIGAVVLAALGTAGILAYELVRAFTVAVSWVSGHAGSIGAGVVLILLLLVLLGGGTAACTGAHCPGCRR
jgi:hypothetical protein